MSSPGRDYIVNTLLTLSGCPNDTSVEKSVIDNKHLLRFVSDAETRTLRAVISKSSGDSVDIDLANDISIGRVKEGCILEIHFLKAMPQAVSKDNMRSLIQVNTLHQNPLHSLYNTIHNIYGPTFKQGSEWADKLPAKLQQLLAELDSGLRSTVLKQNSVSAASPTSDDQDVGDILSPTDEFTYWENNSAGRNRERARKFTDAFDTVKTRYENINALDWSQTKELLDDTQNVLWDVWKADLYGDARYPQKRAAHFLALVSSCVVQYVQSSLSAKKDIWLTPFADIRLALREGISLCDKWAQITDDLTGTFWPGYEQHPWVGDPFEDSQTNRFRARLEEILQIRTMHEELLQILPEQDQRNLRVEDAFKAFDGIEAMDSGAYSQSAWKAAVKEYESKLVPVETQIAANLRKQVAGMKDRPLMLLREFHRYRNLLSREKVSQELSPEREALLSQLTDYLSHLESQYENDFETGAGKQSTIASFLVGKNLSPSVSRILWAQQLNARVQSLVVTGKYVLSGLPGLKDFLHVSESLLSRTTGTVAEEVQRWQKDTERMIKDENISLQIRGKLMEIDRDGNLTVNYSEKLVTLLREVRQLTELSANPIHAIVGSDSGSSSKRPTSSDGKVEKGRSSNSVASDNRNGWVSSKIRAVADEAEKFYRYGVMLKKVANYYNTLESQIISTQRDILLDSLLAFEEVVNNPSATKKGKSVTWSDPSDCEKYVERLQKASEKLSAENRKLRKCHEKLAEDTVILMNIDLLRKRDQWKGKWTDMKEQMSALIKRYGAERMTKWVLHWDYQLYKAIETNYRFGLESLNENLPEIKCELTFAQRRMLFKPPIEELRTTYYKEMKKFVSTPSQFPGFVSNADIFRRMQDRNVKSLINVYSKGEALFGRLQALQDQYEDWMVFGTVHDLDGYVEENVSEVEQYDENFKMIKAKRKESDRLPDIVKIDCISVSVVPLKVAIDEMFVKLQDTLFLCLRKAITTSLKVVELFLDDSMEKLSAVPQTIEEISNGKKEWKNIESKRDSMKGLINACENKKALLMTVTGASSVDTHDVALRLANLPSKWETFEISLEAYNDLIEAQKEKLKSKIEADVMQCNMDLDKFIQRWYALKPKELKSWSHDEIAQVFKDLSDKRQQLDTLVQQAAKHIENCANFQMSTPQFPGMEAVQHDIEKTQQLWGLLEAFNTEQDALASQDWISFRSKMFDLQDFAQKWVDTVKKSYASIVSADGKLGAEKDSLSNANGSETVAAAASSSASSSGASVLEHIQERAKKILKAIPALKFCRGDPFKEEHWTQLFKKLQMPKDVKLENLTVGHFINSADAMDDPHFIQFVKTLQARAQGEVTIRDALQELRAWTETIELSLMDHEEAGRVTPVIKDWKDILLELGDNQSLLQSLKESQFFKPFADQAGPYEIKMANLDLYLSQLNQIQRKWVYLEPIFGKGALPAEQARFKRVDDEFRDVMLTLKQEPLLFNLADESMFPQLGDRLKTMIDQLERCQKALADFLEEKRSKFPRFYFIGDDDLLEILGQSRNPNVIQAHLKKLYQGVYKVKLDGENKKILAMISAAGEEVPLDAPVLVTESVEEWLMKFTVQMQATLQNLVAKCATSVTPDFNAFPSQVLCLAEQVKFTKQCEDAINKKQLDSYGRTLCDTLQQFTALDLSAQPLMQLKLKALVLDLVHMVDVVEQLRNHGCRSVNDWIWQKQLRFYLDKSSASPKCLIRMSDTHFEYTYEYQGNAPKLVHTPLTDKCYLTLTEGMHMGFGGNPYGPAGTGKTESVKALGNAFGRQVLVFNCDEGIDFQSMGRIFMGLVKCGAWGCFDEFNRLKEDQLSAISQQIQLIQDAIKERQPAVRLLGKTIDVDFNAGIFVTLNPAGKGYGGRSKLPDNLKALFRPVAMGIPDNNLIAEVILSSEGFKEAKSLGSKVVSLYTLCKQLLSPQQHYDWGLRPLKAVLNTGGKFIQHAKRETTGHSGGGSNDSNPAKELSLEKEREILIKAVRVNTLSKLTFADCNRFLALIGDVFPGVESSDITGGELEAAMREVMPNKPFNLSVDETQIKKMLQLKESLDQRIGCVVVGPSGSGKTTVWKVLQAAMMKCGQPVKTYVMNPKAMPRKQLLGHMDLDTREWFDGVLTDAARKVVKEPQEIRSWIICDGDVDPEWIESLNSVLDDNRLLTMPNGERISFGTNVNFIFETHDLQFASPATVSRMGMIFLSDEDIDVKRVVRKWLQDQQQTTAETNKNLELWVNDLFYKALESVLGYEHVVATTKVGMVYNGLAHIRGATTKGEFVCGLIRGLGGNLSMEDRNSLAKDIFDLANERPPDMSSPLNSYCKGSTYAVYQSKRDTLGSFDGKLDGSDLGPSAVVPTATVSRMIDVIRPWVDNFEPFILVGPQGCGKNMLISYAFSQTKNCSIATLHCNAQTTAEHVILKIRQSCSLFSTPNGRVYRPRDSERLVLYLKDINLPKPDKYDTCMLIAFLQQLITMNGFYDANLEFLGIEKIQIVASMNPATTVGRHPLSTRFTAAVRICYVDYPSKDELATVYSIFLEALVNTVPAMDSNWKSASTRDKLSASMMEVYEQIRSKFSVDDHRHYLFTPRDLTHWVLGLLRYNLVEENFLDVLSHEAQRLFRDRLVDSDSQAKFDGILGSILRQQWRHNVDFSQSYYTSLSQQAPSQTPSGSSSPRTGNSVVLIRPLLRVKAGDFQNIIQQGIQLYEREEKELGMLLFPEILDHIALVDRVLSKPSGSLFLTGRRGVGRRTAVTLVSHMLSYHMITPKTTRNYSVKNFQADLKTVFQTAGVQGEPVTFYIEDHQISDDAILEIVNSVLSSGEVPGLFTHEETESMLLPLKETFLEAGGNYRTVYDYFVSRVQHNLHLVLSMDPTNNKFLARCESNPALHTSCTILWMGEWRRASLQLIPRLLLQDTDLLAGKEGDLLLQILLSLYETCQRRGATPGEFVCFIQMWQALHVEQHKTLSQSVGHLKGGLQKLEDASDTVEELSKNAEIQRRELKDARAAADEAMEAITKALAEATERRREVEELRQKLGVAEKETNGRKSTIERELSEISPILEIAKQAVGQIKSDNINEIRSLKMPPDAIHDVLSAVLMLLGIQDVSWSSMKKFLGNRTVKEEILNFDARKITPEMRKQVLKLVKSKESSFDHATIYRVSVAAAPLAAWVQANLQYSQVLERIQPLEAELGEAVRTLESFQERLSQCESELKEIDEKVATMKQEFSQKTREAETLKFGLEKAQTTLEKAQNLIGKLGGEQKRWAEQVKELNVQISTLPQKMLLAAGFATFLAKAPEDVRKKQLEIWSDLSELKKTFDFMRTMSSESELLTWKSMGLPSDTLSMENALVVKNSVARVPFIIDPAGASTDWLQSFLARDQSRPLSTILSNDPRFTNQVEQAVRFGKTLLILDVDGVEPLLYPLIRKDLVHEGPRWVVQVGEKSIDYNENFRLLLVTRNPVPNLPPDAAALVVEVNFTVTRSGLQGQLLGVTIQSEQPEIERQKSELLKQEEDYKVQLANLEKMLLEELATSEGNILDNHALIDSLTRTKITAAEIQQALVKSAEASEELDRQREQYRPFADSGSRLYFLTQQLISINHMYQFSLSSFLSLFKGTLGEKVSADSVSRKLTLLTPILERKVLMHVGRSLFKEDRPMFALQLTRGMHPDEFKDNEWQLFIGDLVADIGDGKAPKDFPSWAATDRQDTFRLLQETFPSLVSTLSLSNLDLWRRWSKSPECEKDFPSKLGKAVSRFQQVLVTQTLRPDRLYSSIQNFAADVLGVESISPPPLNLRELMKETNSQTPVLLITTAGADPSKELEEFALESVGREHYLDLAMGGGQQEIAMNLVRKAAEEGDWVCLKNVHLVVAWLPKLEKELNALKPHQRFQLWMTTECHDKFPSILLQQSLKITFESPPGLKKNLQRTLASWGSAYFSKGSALRSQLLFLLAWYHAIVQERRTYIPQGWTKFYEFSYGDLRAGANVMDMVSQSAEESNKPPEWETIHGLMENAIYGGRVDNPYDFNVLKAYLSAYFSDDVLSRRKEISRGMSVPSSNSFNEFWTLVDKLPDSDSPSVFNLPENIERSVQRANSSKVIKLLRALSASSGGGSRFDRESWRSSLSPLLDMWQKLVGGQNSDALSKPKYLSDIGDMDPTDSFTFMENQFAYELVKYVDNGLQSLKRVVYGTGMLTPYIQSLGSAIIAGNVPSDWQSRWESVDNPQAWLRALVLRKVALNKWVDKVGEKSLLKGKLFLSDLFNPGTFLNALRQQTARRLKTSMEALKLVSAWDDQRLHSVPLSVRVDGLLLQGAVFDGQSLIEPEANAPELVDVPAMYIAYVPREADNPYPADAYVSVPLYYTTSRERLLIEVSIPTGAQGTVSKWAMSGVGLFLSDE